MKHPIHEPLADLLEEMKALMDLNGENPFKTRAFDKASSMIRAEAEKIDWVARTKEGTLTEVAGIGKGLAEVISEYVKIGKSKTKEALVASLPEGLLELSKVPGLGPKKARQLIDELGIRTWGELEYACRENRLAKIKGFGLKVQEKILEGVQFLNQNAGRLRLPEATVLAEGELIRVRETFAEATGDDPLEIEVVGEVRRRSEIVERIEILIGIELDAKAERAVRAQFEGKGSGALPVRLHFCAADAFAEEAIRLSSSVEHWERLKKSTGKKTPVVKKAAAGKKSAARAPAGASIIPIGSGVDVAPAGEAAVYAAHGLAWIPAECREDNGEFALARKADGLDSLITFPRMRGVFHMHSTYSDGVMPLGDVIAEAESRGWEYIGISDHSQSAFYAQGLKAEALAKERKEIEALRKKHSNIQIFWGIESDILADGALDYDEETLSHFDFVIASVHSRFQMNREEMTRRVLAAIDHPRTTMIGHLTGRLLLGRKGYEIDAEKVLRRAAERGVIVELNASPARLDLDWRHGELAAEIGLVTSINPDAHYREDFDNLELGVTMARKGLFTTDRVLNAQPCKTVKKWLKERSF